MKNTLEERVDEGKKDELLSLQQKAIENVWIHGAQYARLVEEGILVLERGDGCTVWDVEGNAYFDAFAGLSVVNVGYGRQEIADAIAAQVRQLSYMNGLAYTAPATIKLAHKLASLLPSNLSRVFSHSIEFSGKFRKPLEICACFPPQTYSM